MRYTLRLITNKNLNHVDPLDY